MTVVRVQVTQDDIDQGEIGDACFCPIAQAVRRALPSLPEAAADSSGVWSSNDARFGRADVADVAGLPASATRFISRFDGGEPVHAFAFDLDLPADLLAVTARRAAT